MRIAYLCSIAFVAPIVGYAEPQCVLQAPPVAAEARTGTGKEEVGLPVASSRARSGGTPEPSRGPLLMRSAATVLDHVVAAGAQVTEVGTNHGLLVVVARNDGQFMRLYIAPDGQTLIAGLMSDLTVEDLITMAAGKVTELGSFHGMRGIFVANGGQFQVFYATPDDQRVIPGAMFDAAGKNLTRDHVASIPGAIPTVVIGDEVAVTMNFGPAVLMNSGPSPAV